MSKAGDEEEEDECCFYESLDRLLSSTASSSCCSSTSSSDDDYESRVKEEHQDPKSISGSPDYASPDPPLLIPKFPMGVSNNYDVWTCQPSSVVERRSRLFRQMGLIRDPSVSRQKISFPTAIDDAAAAGGHGRDFSRSVSYCHLNSSDRHCRGETCCNSHINSGDNNSSRGFVRSKSDGSTDHNQRCKQHNNGSASTPCNFDSSSVYAYNIFSVSSPSMVNETFDGGAFVNTNNRNVLHKRRIGNGLPLTDALLWSRPPSGKGSKLGEEIGTEATGLTPSGNGDIFPDSVNDQVCTIKNLDNGKEFVVNEFREDGMWTKLKEIGTGRQLTMEEFEMCVGHSPIVQELMRRQNVEDGNDSNTESKATGISGTGSKLKKTGSWFRSIRIVASSVTGPKDRRSSDEKDTSSEKGGRRSSSATDDSQDVSFHGPERVRVRQYGKSCKELTALYKTQEIQAHNGSIWTIKFSLDGKYLASAGEDCVIHVWQVVESERKGDLLVDKADDGNLNYLLLANGSPEPTALSPSLEGHLEKKRRGRSSTSRKSVSLDHIVVPETVFALSEKPICSFQGHSYDVLDLSWSKSQLLLSSSMDKTVRLWHLPTKACLKIFSHSDYVTCIQFNPVDDRYFISGSLDAKVRIWSIPDRQVVDWNDLHEMVTAACYTPDGQGALVGSNEGSCHLYNFSDCKLQQKGQINLQNKKKKGHQKKITGFQFAPGSASKVLITSADSRIRFVDGDDLVHKLKGFRNTNSQISASITTDGKYVVCASEDSHVYVWKNDGDFLPSRSKGVTVTQSYEHFHCRDVSVAIPWPGTCDSWGFEDAQSGDLDGVADHFDGVSTVNHPPTPVEETNGNESSSLASACSNSPLHGTISSASNSYLLDRISATWPEEKLLVATKNCSPQPSWDFYDGVNQNRSAWGLVIVTAGLRGEIKTFQNFEFPLRI